MSVPHFIGCTLLFGQILISFAYIYANDHVKTPYPWGEYGWFSVFLYIPTCLVLLGLPQSIFNFLGLVFFQSFPKPPRLQVTRILNMLGINQTIT